MLLQSLHLLSASHKCGQCDTEVETVFLILIVIAMAAVASLLAVTATAQAACPCQQAHLGIAGAEMMLR